MEKKKYYAIFKKSDNHPPEAIEPDICYISMQRASLMLRKWKAMDPSLNETGFVEELEHPTGEIIR